MVVRTFMLFSHKVAEPLGGARSDYDILADVAERMGCGDVFTEGRDEADWLRELVHESEIPDEEEFRRTGIHFGADQERVGLAAFSADPAAHPLSTPSGTVELSGAACVAAGLSAVPEARVQARSEGLPLRLVTPKARLRIHSQLGALPWFRRRDERALWMHPDDAAARGVKDGARVEVRSAQGRVRCPVRVTADVMPGVVALTAGVEPDFDDAGRDVAGAANVLTSDAPTLPSRGATLSCVAVEVDAAGRDDETQGARV